MRQSSRILLASLLLISAKASADDKSAEALLQQMQSAVHQQNFELSMVKARQGRLEPIRISHAVINGKEVAHLSYLDGKAIEYLQRENEFTFFENSHDPYTLKDARFPGIWSSLVSMPLSRVLQSYDPVLAGRSRVAGVVAQVVRLVPKEADKYGFMLWVDEQSHLLLRVDMVEREGNLVEQLLGVDLELQNKPAPWLVTLANSKLPPALALEDAYPAPQQQLNWQVTWLPDGFKVLSQDRHQLVTTSMPVDYMMLSDGLVDLSVYVSRVDPKQAVRQQLIRQGATSLVSFVNEVGVEITVVGEVPAETAKRIAESVQPLARNEAVQ
ncbi:MucB/RseB C-terminal domain-containing protein [Aeromonas jandaei]|uniref:MucB/RseB C-terminal domain-containing protein n=1 Tax=Aeromonas TaxID=642 RepID=UPI00059D932A|nr:MULTISPECIES: MucB/RseB C-terminal domain-containing protein [Aeromonas]MCQ4055996.1 MucB/RseB C-terminal domain-containing protein [Aeromonas sp. SG16]MBL0599947.1 MucB/RseB C-terminal domain-containing protein [Aeromonas jandaei]MBL0612774.1 MucB/RseB C-terminal domain-containing protein [Aeromonas jandaei]MBL0668728.1 MucB/RseB C-terminal domain-containing protein [Aeromonas jandaei]MBW3763269.1 transcriptional regulator [Aeromonas jandaei]